MKMKSTRRAAALMISSLVFSFSQDNQAYADLKCLKLTQRNGNLRPRVITTSNSKCPRGTSKLFDTVNLVGPQGLAGTDGRDGEDGKVRVFGDGSAGDLVVSGTKTLRTDIAADGNYQFVNCTIPNGAILYMPSGTVLRCAGNFENRGTIYVKERQRPGDNIKHAARPGIGGEAASIGECGDNSVYRNSAKRVNGLFGDDGANVLNPGTSGGGDGGSNAVTSSNGGGSLTILVKGTFTNSASGSIVSIGGVGAEARGGGGGGVIILGSQTSINNAGSLIAIGGSGGNRNEFYAASGGGGGGIIHLISPVITQGTINVSGGSAGVATGAAYNTASRCGGSSGGASAGDGGAGAGINVIGTTENAEAGGSGSSFTTYADPMGLF